jgi:predicted ATPase/class 3 adenylate cyclase
MDNVCMALPTGTVTFVFTDIEGSTRLLTSLGDSYADVLEEHRKLVRASVGEAGGQEFGTEGDAFFLVFSSAPAALRAAVDIQRRLAQNQGGGGQPLRIRVGVHTGEGVLREGDYVGIDVHRAARIAAAGHGGQILLSDPTRTLVEHDLPDGTTLRDLGEHRLKDLEHPERIHQADVSGLPTSFPPLKTLDRPAGNLPVQLTSFIGRQRELEQARSSLAGTRLLTLTGPGGTGKTRLSVQLASLVQDEFDDGAWFVALAPVTDPGLVPEVIAETLGLAEVRGESRRPLQRVIDHLRDRDILLVLDNFEQVLPAADVAAELLRAAPGVKVVVTTRAALRVSGEQEFPVPPLGLPDPRHLPDLASLSQYEAVALFIDRATSVKPGFAVTNQNAPAVAEITARLDGLPLAIELAAARSRLLSPQAMLARLGDRLALLSSGRRDLPARQQTLRQAIAWSHDLLSEPERAMFARLAVFMGGWTLDEAEAVCGPADDVGMDVLDGLESLVDKSLVRTQEGDEGEQRFGMLETIREFAVEQLEGGGEADAFRRRHADVYLGLGERAEPELTRRDSKRWLDRLEPEHDNFRAALEWAIGGGEARLGLSLVSTLWRFWQMRGHLHEGRMWSERALAVPGVEGYPRDRARALEAAGGLAYWQFDIETTERRYRESLRISEEVGDTALIANALYNLSFAFGADFHPEARPALERALHLYEELGDVDGMAKVHWGMANLDLMAEYNPESARRHLETSLELARRAGDEFQAAWALFMLGGLGTRENDAAAATGWFSEALRTFAQVEDVTGILFNLEGLALAALLEGRAARGIKLGAAAQVLRAQSGTSLTDPDEESRFREMMEKLPEDEVSRLRAEGERLSTEEAIAYGLSDED